MGNTRIIGPLFDEVKGPALDYDRAGEAFVRLLNEHRRMRANLLHVGHPPEHFYSPIPSARDIETYLSWLKSQPINKDIPGIDTNEAGQLDLLRRIALYGERCESWPEKQTDKCRYYYGNLMYSHGDAAMLITMLSELKPARVMEIGSGFSSALMLDFDEFYTEGDPVNFSFIEPNDQRLKLLLRNQESANLISRPVQELNLDDFKVLQAGDILFIDCSHITKIGSDVNFIYHRVLPALAPGVWVHIHDIFGDFEYPEHFTRHRFYWNEQYLARAFLQFNSAYRIELWGDWLYRHHRETLLAALPLCERSAPQQIWLQRV